MYVPALAAPDAVTSAMVAVAFLCDGELRIVHSMIARLDLLSLVEERTYLRSGFRKTVEYVVGYNFVCLLASVKS